MKNILFLYDARQTYTNTVYDHISSFVKYSKNRVFFLNQSVDTLLKIDLSRFDAVGIHYSIRLPYDQISPSTVVAFRNFSGLKFLFIQDEYDYVYKTWDWIKTLGIKLVFTVVPENSIEKVYPKQEFPDTHFISVLTGYAPNSFGSTLSLLPPSKRKVNVGYRGRPLPIHYGKLGKEKVSIGEVIKEYCYANDIDCDIAWDEESRIYGPKWIKFMASCRSMLGSESGSNVFDWHGNLEHQIKNLKAVNPKITDDQIYEEIISPIEIDGIMNQISPKVFEAIHCKTVLIMYEGNYSNILIPGLHYLPLKKDHSNLSEVMKLLKNDNFVDLMVERAYEDIIKSEKYGYESFVSLVDKSLDTFANNLKIYHPQDLLIISECLDGQSETEITTRPIRANPLQQILQQRLLLHRIIYFLWRRFIPKSLKAKIRQKVVLILTGG